MFVLSCYLLHSVCITAYHDDGGDFIWKYHQLYPALSCHRSFNIPAHRSFSLSSLFTVVFSPKLDRIITSSRAKCYYVLCVIPFLTRGTYSKLLGCLVIPSCSLWFVALNGEVSHCCQTLISFWLQTWVLYINRCCTSVLLNNSSYWTDCVTRLPPYSIFVDQEICLVWYSRNIVL